MRVGIKCHRGAVGIKTVSAVCTEPSAAAVARTAAGEIICIVKPPCACAYLAAVLIVVNYSQRAVVFRKNIFVKRFRNAPPHKRGACRSAVARIKIRREMGALVRCFTVGKNGCFKLGGCARLCVNKSLYNRHFCNTERYLKSRRRGNLGIYVIFLLLKVFNKPYSVALAALNACGHIALYRAGNRARKINFSGYIKAAYA